MTLLFNCQSISKSFGNRLLFRDLSLSLFKGDRVGLIGPNGAGKTTLLKIIAGVESPDQGILSPKKDLQIGYVPQTCEFPDLPLDQILIDAQSKKIPDYEKRRHAETWLSKLGFTDPHFSAQNLSGGWKKRLGLATALILSPDLLLIDEPTNHLDLEGIVWLEKFLEKEMLSYLLVSHDRYFLQNTTNRIIEIDPTYPKGLFAIQGNYAHFLSQKEAFLSGQLQQERSLSSKARRESDWLDHSPKARTTKSRARVDEAHELLEELSQIKERNRQKRAGIDFISTERETRKLLVAKNLSKDMEGRLLFSHLDFILSPGTRIGLMGPNGSGKTTLLRLLAGETNPTQGTLKRADDLRIVYFDQHRMQIPLTSSLRQALSPQGDYVLFQGEHIHVNGWCKRFLFSPSLLDMPIAKLSGGERARISIAHLMLQPADLLLLDEPTNDLDIPTLETLEESLLDFPGALVLITHDRCMLDRICNSVLALGNPEKCSFYADYSQWESSQKVKLSEEKPKEKSAEGRSSRAKLSYLEKREYEEMESKISKLEEEVRLLNHSLEEEAIVQDPSRLTQVCEAVGLIENQIEQLYLRWEELEKKLRS